jgi:hypothetical protein
MVDAHGPPVLTNQEAPAMTTTMRSVLTTLSASLLAVTTWLTPAAAMPSLDNLLSSGGGATLKLPDVIHPSNFRLQRSLKTTGLSDVTVRWKDTSPADTSTVIERANAAGVWSTLTILPGALNDEQVYVDGGLPADSEWCYRIRIRGANNAEVVTLPRCVVTQKLNDIGVFRTQLRIRVANVSGGGTDGRVSVALQAGPFHIPTGSYTGLKTPIDDLAAGSDVTYDLIQEGITTLRDITRIGVYTGSTDGFCVSQIQLIVNTKVAFDRTWGESTCEWVDGYNAIFVSHAELRASPLFANFQSPVMSPLVETEELASRLETIVGTLIFERLDVDWRAPVAVSRLSDNAVRANIYLEATGFAGPNIDLEFDVQVAFNQSGNAWELSFVPVNFRASVDFAWWAEGLVLILDPVCVPVAAIAGAEFAECMGQLEDHIATQIKKGFDLPTKRIPVSLPANCMTPAVTVLADGALYFECAAMRTTPTTFTKGTIVNTGVTVAPRLVR